jgi:hypothetical protein
VNAAQVETGALQRGNCPIERGSDGDHVIELADAVGMSRSLVRHLTIRPPRRQPVQLGPLDIA